MGWGGGGSPPQLLCATCVQSTTNSRICWGVGGVCFTVFIFLELDQSSKVIFKNYSTRSSTYEFLRHLKYLVKIEERARIRKKRLVEVEASPSLIVSILRFSNSFGTRTCLHTGT
jgi:hypothetical protein